MDNENAVCFAIARSYQIQWIPRRHVVLGCAMPVLGDRGNEPSQLRALEQDVALTVGPRAASATILSGRVGRVRRRWRMRSPPCIEGSLRPHARERCRVV
jgi:hypothetical protein